jgi:hypothetical protein
MAAVVVAAALGGVGCGGDDGTSAEDAATAAARVCDLLRTQNDSLGTALNQTSQEITDADDPTTANDVLLDGWDDLLGIADAYIGQVRSLSIPDIPDHDQVIEDLTTGAEESYAVISEEREEAEALEPIDVEDQRGALGGAFTGLERATSVLEPQVARYDATLQQAFADDDGCANVVQPTGG